jgi:dephospho-CoA kinase
MDRNKISAKEAQTKIDSQMPILEKVKKADILIDNSGTLEELKLQITEKTIPAIIKRL